MSARNKTYDVFLSASSRDAKLVKVVYCALEGAGLTVFYPEAEVLGREPKIAEPTRKAIAECAAFVALLSPSHVKSEFLAFELGGALMWEKAIYLLLDRLTPKELPSFLKTYESKTFDVKKLEKLIPSIKASVEPLSEHDRDLLAKTYLDLGIDPEQLSFEPSSLDLLTETFNARSDAQISSERLFRELVRLRKQRKLPRLPHRETRRASAK
jgi:TIR domain